MSEETNAATLLDAIENATKETLKEIQLRIEALDRQLASLRAAEKLVAAGLGIPLTKRVPGSGRKAGGRKPVRSDSASAAEPAPDVPAEGDGESHSELMNERRRAVYRYLQHNGITRQSVLAEDLKIPPGTMTAVLRHKWFESRADGVQLAK